MADPLRLAFNPPAAANDNGCEREALRVEDFISDCVVLPEPNQDKIRLEKILAILRKGAYGTALVADVIDRQGINVAFNKAAGFARYGFWLKGMSIAKENLLLEMNPEHPNFDLAAYLAHELRHAQQCCANRVIIFRNLSVYDVNHYNRFVEADAQTVAILACFELMVKYRDSLPFSAYKNTTYDPMCKVIWDEYDKDPHSLYTSALRRKVFDAWFQDFLPRGTYDQSSLENAVLNYFSPLPRSALTPQDLARVAQSGGEKENYLTLP